MTEPSRQTAKALEALCRDEGFDLAGAAPLEGPSHSAEFRRWIDSGRHGEMGWLEETIEERLDPARLLEGARSVVMVADFYSHRPAGADPERAESGRIARYARGRDYHDVIRRRLRRVCDQVRDEFPGARTRAFCDTAPVAERDLAALCGLGWIGKHTLLIHPELGSWMLLGGFLTTLEVGERPPAISDHCGTCTRCLDACPTSAIQPHSVDASRCVSYLTIEHRSQIDPELASGLDGWLVGCDVCQEVCPHNSSRTDEPDRPVRPEYDPRRSGFDLLEVLGWDEATRRARFATSALKRVSLAQVKRTAAELAANELSKSHDPSRLRAELERVAWSPNEPEHARASARRALGAPPSST